MAEPARARLRRLALRAVARLVPSPGPLQRPAREILLVRPDHLGDVLLTTPAVAALRRAAPNARLSLMVGPWSKLVAERGPLVDEILTCDFPGFTRSPAARPVQPYWLLLAEAARLRRSGYELAVLLRPDHWWGALLTAVAGIPVRLGYDTPLTRLFLTAALPMPAGAHAARLSLTLAARAAMLAGGRAEADDAAPTATFRLSPEERAWASSTVGAFDRPIVLLHPGSGSALKSWPADRWAQVADALVEDGAHLVVTGGADDLESPRAVAAAMRHTPLLLAGSTTLGQLAALAERCSLAIGSDNGPLHIAAALGVPTLRIYGPTDEAVFGPWGAPGQHVALSHPLLCRPCGNLIDPPCGARATPACLRGIDADTVARLASEHLAAHRRPTPASA